MRIRPGCAGMKSCFSLARVLKTRSGMRSPFQGPRSAKGASTLPCPRPPAVFRFRSAVEDRLQVAFDVVLVDALGERKLLDEEIAGGVEHLALAEAEVLVELEQ